MFVKTASVLEVSFIRYWYGLKFGKSEFGRGCDALMNVYEQFVDLSQSKTNANEPVTPDSAKNEPGFSQMKMFFFVANKNEQIYAAKESSLRQIRIEIEKEIIKFKEILNSHKMVYKHSTSYFWLSNSKELPHLNKLSIILLNIQASSAFIERFLV